MNSSESAESSRSGHVVNFNNLTSCSIHPFSRFYIFQQSWDANGSKAQRGTYPTYATPSTPRCLVTTGYLSSFK